MKTSVKDLTVEELKKVISDVVRETLEEFLEDIEALYSTQYLKSIEEARTDYKAGRVKSLEKVDSEWESIE